MDQKEMNMDIEKVQDEIVQNEISERQTVRKPHF